MLIKHDEKTIERIIRKVMNEVMDEKLDIKLKPLYDFKDDATRLLKAILDILQGKVHPDDQHTSVL